MNSSIAFIGGGNMAQAIVGGLLKKGCAAERLFVLEVKAAARARWAAWSVACADTWPVDKRFDAVVLAVKPQQMEAALRPLADHLRDSLIISIAAGVPIVRLSEWLGGHTRIVRSMPNLPAMIGEGMTAAITFPEAHENDRRLTEEVLQACGEFIWVAEEPMLNAITAISGSGPGYIFYFMEWLEKAARDLGFSAEDAHTLVVQTFKGSALLAAQSAEGFDVLRERVTSPGGTTAAALEAMEQADVGRGIFHAANAAHKRSVLLLSSLENKVDDDA
ncbi:MAG: pyrroline-5-carboxylate reductase [Burkholderiaceae bacterium]|jgi:pyrroline-5-carboxylate reductase